MKNLILLFILISGTYALSAQDSTSQSNKVKRFYFRDNIVSIETWYGNDKIRDSIKTYHKTGALDEIIYFKKGRYHKAYKYNRKGEKVTTWTFTDGKLNERIDHILQFNKKDEELVKGYHARLKEINTALKTNPRNLRLITQRANLRYRLNNRVFAKHDFMHLSSRMLKFSKAKKIEPHFPSLAFYYDALGNIYSSFEMESYATHYRYLATKNHPENNIYKYNFGSYLYSKKAYREALVYLEHVISKWKKHAFSHRALAAIYTDFEDYERAMNHTNIAFERKEKLIEFGWGNVERDVYTLRGYLNHKLGNSEQGINDLKEAIRLNENNSFAHRNIGAVYYDIGEFTLACEHLQKAKELGYEQIHDRDDLQAYFELSCENAARIENEKKNESEIALTPKDIAVSKLTNKPYIFPNPTKGNIHIKNLSFKDYKYLIFDYAGRLVLEGMSKETAINISHLPTGAYILKVSKKGESETFRVLKD